jgi:hypothetical protein
LYCSTYFTELSLAFDGQYLRLYTLLYLSRSSKERDLIGLTSTGEGKMAHFRRGALYFPAQFQEGEQPAIDCVLHWVQMSAHSIKQAVGRENIKDDKIKTYNNSASFSKT